MFKFVIICALLGLVSCGFGESRGGSAVLTDFVGTKIKMPRYKEYLLQGDTIAYDFDDADYKIVTLINASSCVPCEMKPSLWTEIINELKGACDVDVNFVMMKNAGISTDGLFLNADAGFDCHDFRRKCEGKGIIANVDFNNHTNNDQKYLLDTELLSLRYSIERTNAWMDSFRSVLNRFDKTVSNWKGWNLLAFHVIFLKHINKFKKSR